MTRRRFIDGIRALAIALVIAFHVSPGSVPGGFIGVDVFFVISGYLITGLIVRARREGTFTYAGFYGRRIRRLFPALLVVLVASGIAGWFLLTPADLALLGRSIAAGASFVPNLVLWRSASYFDATAQVNPMVHLWSLGVEEQFYLVWPLLLVVLLRRQRWLAPGIWTVVGASFALSCWLAVTHPVAAFYLPVSRLWELGIGALLAVHVPGGGDAPRWLSERRATLVSVAALGLLGASALLITVDTPFPGPAALGPTVAAALLLAAGERSWVNRRILSTRVLVGIGLISYPLYLWHWPMLAMFDLSTGEPASWSVRAVLILLVVLAVLLSWLTYRFIEIPAQTRLPSPAGTIALVAAMVAVAIGGVALDRGDGFPSRYRDEIREIARWQHTHDPYAGIEGCFSGRTDQPRTEQPCYPGSEADGMRSIVIWGDSHAAALASGARRRLAPDETVWQFTRGACPPVLDYGDASCRRLGREVLDEIEAHPPDLLVLAGRWADYEGDDGRLDRSATDLSSQLERTLDEVDRATSGRVVLIGPGPNWEPDLATQMLDHYYEHRPHRIPARLPATPARTLEAVDGNLAAMAAARDIRYGSPFQLLCNDAGCLTHLPGRPTALYTHDYGHLTLDGAEDLTDRLVAAGVLR